MAFSFYTKHYDDRLLKDVKVDQDGGTALIVQSTWDNIYKKGMDPVRDWMKANQNKILEELNNNLFKEIENKYAEGDLSKWEMDSLSFYYHDHELASLKNTAYDIVDYNSLKNNEIDRTFPDEKNGGEIVLYKIYRIAGTVIDKDKNKSTVVLLTPTGVVNVKVWKNQFAKWDKQIFEKDADGVKHVIEKSWFTRGNKLIITGIRRDDTFVPKKYKNTKYPLFEKILEIDNGFITNSITERAEEE
jgi:DNA polymerase-3 subunit alpha